MSIRRMASDSLICRPIYKSATNVKLFESVQVLKLCTSIRLYEQPTGWSMDDTEINRRFARIVPIIIICIEIGTCVAALRWRVQKVVPWTQLESLAWFGLHEVRREGKYRSSVIFVIILICGPHLFVAKNVPPPVRTSTFLLTPKPEAFRDELLIYRSVSWVTQNNGHCLGTRLLNVIERS